MDKSFKEFLFLFTIFSVLLLSSTITLSYSIETGNSKKEKSSVIVQSNAFSPDYFPLPLSNEDTNQINSNQVKHSQPHFKSITNESINHDSYKENSSNPQISQLGRNGGFYSYTLFNTGFGIFNGVTQSSEFSCSMSGPLVKAFDGGDGLIDGYYQPTGIWQYKIFFESSVDDKFDTALSGSAPSVGSHSIPGVSPQVYGLLRMTLSPLDNTYEISNSPGIVISAGTGDKASSCAVHPIKGFSQSTTTILNHLDRRPPEYGYNQDSLSITIDGINDTKPIIITNEVNPSEINPYPSIRDSPVPKSQIKITTKNPDGTPASFIDLNVEACSLLGSQTSDGHIHDITTANTCHQSERPPATLSDGTRTGNPLSVKTDSNGEITVDYLSPSSIGTDGKKYYISGKDRILVSLNSNPYIKHSM